MENEVKYKVIKPLYDIEIRYIDEVKGYGVFTKEFIPEGSIVEICYCLKIPSNQTTHASYDYVFYEHNKNINYLPFGYGPVYNHSNDANLNWKVTDYDKNIIEFYSLKDINIDEEMCHNYGEIYWKAREKKLI